MAQVIEVRFQNPANGDILHDCMTLATSHENAIQLALDDWSGGVGKIVEMQKWEGVGQGKYQNPSSFRYIYHVALKEEEYDRSMMAVLFAQYKEKPPEPSRQ